MLELEPSWKAAGRLTLYGGARDMATLSQHSLSAPTGKQLQPLQMTEFSGCFASPTLLGRG